MLTRRRAVSVLGAVMGLPFLGAEAGAAVARGLRLEELASRSTYGLRGLPLEAYSEWARFDGQKRIVTYTRFRVDDAFFGGSGQELMLRTLGGQVGEIGQIVSGEAQLTVGEPCVLFTMPFHDGALGVTGMAQGHYPLLDDDTRATRLSASAQVAKLLDDKSSAVVRLNGQTLPNAKALIQKARP